MKKLLDKIIIKDDMIGIRIKLKECWFGRFIEFIKDTRRNYKIKRVHKAKKVSKMRREGGSNS